MVKKILAILLLNIALVGSNFANDDQGDINVVDEILIEVKDNPWDFVEHNLFIKPSQECNKFRWPKKILGGLIAGSLTVGIIRKIVSNDWVDEQINSHDTSTGVKIGINASIFGLPLISALTAGYLISREAPKHNEHNFVESFLKDWPKNKKLTPESLHEKFDQAHKLYLNNPEKVKEEYKKLLAFVKEKVNVNQVSSVYNLKNDWELLNDELNFNIERKSSNPVSKLSRVFGTVVGAACGFGLSNFIAEEFDNKDRAKHGEKLRLRNNLVRYLGLAFGSYVGYNLTQSWQNKCNDNKALHNFIVMWPEFKKHAPKELHKNFDDLYALYKESFNGSQNYNRFMKNNSQQFLALIRQKIDSNLPKPKPENKENKA